MENLKPFFDNFESTTIYLTYTRMKSIEVCLDPMSFPNFKPAFKLNDSDHKTEIIFCKESMDLINTHSRSIKKNLKQGYEKLFFINEELKVYSEKLRNQYVVCFLSIQGVRINMILQTFMKLMSLSDEISVKYKNLLCKVNETSKYLTQFLDLLLTKSNQFNIQNPQFIDFLQQLQENTSSICIETTSHLSNISSQIYSNNTSNDNSCYSDDNSNEYEEDSYYGGYSDEDYLDEEDEYYF